MYAIHAIGISFIPQQNSSIHHQYIREIMDLFVQFQKNVLRISTNVSSKETFLNLPLNIETVPSILHEES